MDTSGSLASSPANFLSGLVFGFDVGTASIGYAVRKQAEFKDAGVLICPEGTNDLSGRRGLRSQRRRLRNRSRIRVWLNRQLEERLGLPSPWTKAHNGQFVLKEGLDGARISNPVRLRCEALEGQIEKPEELHAAIVHLWKRRGKTEVPWKQGEVKQETDEQKKEKQKVAAKLNALASEMAAGDGTQPAKPFEHPCQLLRHRQKIGIKQRDEVWPRDEFQNSCFNLKKEFLAIIRIAACLTNEKGERRFPKLSDAAAEWILYGETQAVISKGQERRVYFKTTECENPGVLGLRWPRFENRNPGLDLLRPIDDLDRPLHVVRRNKPVFQETQFEQAIFNFRAIDKATGKRVLPDLTSLNRLREIYESSKRNPKKNKKVAPAIQDGNKLVEIKITEGVLNTWAKEYAGKYELIEDSPDLVSRAGDGRARFCSATLREIKQVLEKLSTGQTVDAIQPLLRMQGESKEQAMARFLGDIRHGLVRHRLTLFLQLFRRLVREHGKPDFIVIEAVRSLAFSKKKKDEHKKEQKKNREARDQIYQKLKAEEKSTSKDTMLRYRLAKEAGFECPFCRQSFNQADLFNGAVDISHLYPKSLTPCNEFYNLTVAHARCNRTDMEAKIPRVAFGSESVWPDIEANARKRFSGKKLELFLAQTPEDAERLIESKAPLAATAYISKMIRRLCLIDLQWHGDDGRDPTNKEGNIPSQRFLVTNGEITARYRETWQLNDILHKPIPVFTDDEWERLTDDEKQAHKEARKRRFEKNRGDHRHHALDAMVISCTWPAYAQRVHNATKDWEGKGWWYFDKTKNQLLSKHPLFENYEPMRAAVTEWMDRLVSENRVCHHASKSKHGQAYKTSFFSQRPDGARSGEHFYLMREKLLDISPKDLRLGKVHPPGLSHYLFAAWDSYLEKLYIYIERAALGFVKTFDAHVNTKQAVKEFANRLEWADFRACLQDQSKEPSLAAKEAVDKISLNTKAMPEFKRNQADEWVVKLPEPEKLLKTIPADFQTRICFSHYQKWSHERPARFDFPKHVVIPITRVRYRQPVNDNSVAVGPKTIPGWAGGRVYVKRDGYREVRLMPYARGTGVVPVFVPLWRKDKPFSAYEFTTDGKPLLTIRKSQVIRLRNDYSPSYPAGDYLVEVLGEHQVTLNKPHIANTKEARIANDFPATGFKPYWHKLIPALGFEFPKEIHAIGDEDESKEDDE